PARPARAISPGQRAGEPDRACDSSPGDASRGGATIRLDYDVACLIPVAVEVGGDEAFTVRAEGGVDRTVSEEAHYTEIVVCLADDQDAAGVIQRDTVRMHEDTAHTGSVEAGGLRTIRIVAEIG